MNVIGGTRFSDCPTLEAKLFRASCLVNVIAEVLLDSDNACEGETLKAAEELILTVFYALEEQTAATKKAAAAVSVVRAVKQPGRAHA